MGTAEGAWKVCVNLFGSVEKGLEIDVCFVIFFCERFA